MSESKQIHILYMEDDAAAARLLQKRLKRAGYAVDVAHDGEEGLAMYAAGSYDVVVVDQSMPIHDGLEVLRLLASQGRLPPPIMVTGAGDEKTAVEAMRLGVSDYIVKDLDGRYLELLPSVVERALQQQRLVEEKQRAEEGLKESEERYRDLFENANDLIQSVAPDGHFVYVNRAWRETLGYDEEEIASLSIFDIIHPDSQAHCMEVFQRVMSGEKVDKVEAVFVTKDGKKVTVEGNADCKFVDGKPVYTRGIFRDITERKRAEEAIHRYVDIVSNMQVGLQVYQLEDPEDDRSLRMITTNPAAILFTGMAVEDVVGKRIDEIFPGLREVGIPQTYADVVRTGVLAGRLSVSHSAWLRQ